MRAAWLAAFALIPGCSLIQDPAPRALEGATDGYLATSPYLKVYVRSNDSGQLLLIDFDRKDWHVAGIVKKLDERALDYLAVHAAARSIPGEYLVDKVLSPTELDGYRYDTNPAKARDRALLDAEYDAILERVPDAPQGAMEQGAGLQVPTGVVAGT